MTGTELIITTFAILFSPIIAVQVERQLDKSREKYRSKATVFHTLMATRASRLSQAHVEALNRIDIEFYGKTIYGVNRPTKEEKQVLDAWRIYRDHLFTRYDEKTYPAWMDKGTELFTELLYQLSRACGYNFDKVYLKNSIYAPIWHATLEHDLEIIRANLEALTKMPDWVRPKYGKRTRFR